MSSPGQPYSEMHIKGGLVRARFLFVALNHGAPMWARILAGLSEEDRQVLKEIALDNWYPLATLDRVDRAIAEEIGGDEEDIFKQLGEFSATSSLSGPYSSLLDPDIHSFLKQSSLIHRSYQDFGFASYKPTGDTSGTLTITYDDPPPLSYCTSGSAYFRRAVELCGARSARITHPACSALGDSECEFIITWQP